MLLQVPLTLESFEILEAISTRVKPFRVIVNFERSIIQDLYWITVGTSERTIRLSGRIEAYPLVPVHVVHVMYLLNIPVADHSHWLKRGGFIDASIY